MVDRQYEPVQLSSASVDIAEKSWQHALRRAPRGACVPGDRTKCGRRNRRRETGRWWSRFIGDWGGVLAFSDYERVKTVSYIGAEQMEYWIPGILGERQRTNLRTAICGYVPVDCVEFGSEYILDLLSTLNSDKGRGTDKIPAVVLTECDWTSCQLKWHHYKHEDIIKHPIKTPQNTTEDNFWLPCR